MEKRVQKVFTVSTDDDRYEDVVCSIYYTHEDGETVIDDWVIDECTCFIDDTIYALVEREVYHPLNQN